MRSYVSKLKNYSILFKVDSFTSIWVFVKLITGLITSKIITIVLGAEGMALTGHLRNLLTIIRTIATLSLYDGVVNYIKKNKTDKEQLIRVLSTSYYICFVMTMILSAWLYYKPDFWNILIFGSSYQYHFIFEAMGVVLPFYAANVLCLAIINGFSKYKVYILLNIVSSLLGVLITLMLIWEFRIEGALIAIVLNPAISLLITIVVIMNQRNFAKLLWANRISFAHIKWLSPYMVMVIIMAVILPAILIKIRQFITVNESILEAGYWESVQRLSDQYISGIAIVFTASILPKLSKIKKREEIKEKVLDIYKILLPVIAISLLGMYICRKIIIKILFSDDFLVVESLFLWQLSGDFFKIASLVILYVFMAKKMIWHFVLVEITLCIILYFSSIYLIKNYAFIGASIAHCITYASCFILLILMFINSFCWKQNKMPDTVDKN